MKNRPLIRKVFAGDAEIEDALFSRWIDFERDHGGLFNGDGVEGSAEKGFDEAGEVGLVADDGDGVEFAEGGQFFERLFGVHAAGKPGFNDGRGTSFFGENFGSFFGPEHRAGEKEVGDEIVFTKEVPDAVCLFDSFWNESPGKVPAGESVRLCGGVSNQVESHLCVVSLFLISMSLPSDWVFFEWKVLLIPFMGVKASPFRETWMVFGKPVARAGNRWGIR